MGLTAYQQTILIWLYGLQNYLGIFANVPPPPAGIVPPPVSQAPTGEAWLAFDTTASEPSTGLDTFPDIPGTTENDPQQAIAAMPEYVFQIGGILLLTLNGAHAVESLAREGLWPELSEEVLANIEIRIAILETVARKSERECAQPPSELANSPRWNTNTALLARARYITQAAGDDWMLTDPGKAAWDAFCGNRLGSPI